MTNAQIIFNEAVELMKNGKIGTTGNQFEVEDENGGLFLYIAKPSKGSNIWRSISDHHNLYDFRKKFQFVKWEDEKPTSIQEVLNNCEVIEDD